MTDYYRDSLAHVHDVGFGRFAEQAAPAILQLFQRSGIDSGLVVDLGCGSGIWAAALLKSGYQVLGIDISAGMLRIARRRAPGARFQQASFLDAQLPPCRAITAVGEPLSYALDPNVTAPTLAKFFRRAFDALSPGGVFVFDVLRSDVSARETRQQGFWEADDWTVLTRFERDDRANVLTRHITTFRKSGKLYRRDHEIHRVRMYDARQLAKALRKAGFRVQLRRGYGEYRLRPYHVVFIARRP